MSLILDALRKSEHERERRSLPGLVDLPAYPDTGRSRLPLALAGIGVLLAVNVIVLSIAWLRPKPATPAPAATAAPGTAATAAALPVARPPDRPAPSVGSRFARSSRATGVRPLGSEAGAADATPDYPRPPPSRARTTTEPSLVRRAPAASAAPVAAGARAPRVGPESAGVPSINELPTQALTGLPRLNIDLHVYSPDPAQRFVVVNGQRLREGEALREGPTLERITADGVVLNHQGTRFLLPRE
jgi:general secretion pathway protein B